MPGRKSGVPNYQNELLLNIVEGILPSGPEQWKIVALNYQQAAKEDFLRYYDDVRRHFIEMLCKKMQRQTGLNNKSGPTPEVARAQLIHRKILVNEAAVTAEGDNEAEDMEKYEDAVNDDENEEEDDDKEDDFQPSTSPIEERSSNAPPKRKGYLILLALSLPCCSRVALSISRKNPAILSCPILLLA
jgi:hypothetical protein